jgi:hypothetical protein
MESIYSIAFRSFAEYNVGMINTPAVAAVAVDMAWNALSRIDAELSAMDRRAVNYSDRCAARECARERIELFVACVMEYVARERCKISGTHARVAFHRSFLNARKAARENAERNGGAYFDGVNYYFV